MEIKDEAISEEQLVPGYIPKPLSPLDYHELIRELRAIGKNLNQLAKERDIPVLPFLNFCKWILQELYCQAWSH